jgi:hypothetical protein
MYIDKQLEFSDAQAITADAVSTNVIQINKGDVDGDAGVTDIKIYVGVVEAFNTLTSLNVTLQTSVDAAFSSPVVLQTVNAVLANLTAGDKVELGCLPLGCLEYVRLNYDVVGTNPTTGTIDAGLVLGRQANG